MTRSNKPLNTNDPYNRHGTRHQTQEKSGAGKVVGIAGGLDKCNYVVDELGFDACIDYKDGASFEQALADLEGIVRELESGQGDLEKSITDYERGMKLKEHCMKHSPVPQQRVTACLSNKTTPATFNASHSSNNPSIPSLMM